MYTPPCTTLGTPLPVHPAVPVHADTETDLAEECRTALNRPLGNSPIAECARFDPNRALSCRLRPRVATFRAIRLFKDYRSLSNLSQP